MFFFFKKKKKKLGKKKKKKKNRARSFSTTGNVEGQWFLAGNNLTSLSESNLVDCDYNPPNGNQGCNGGLPSLAYQFIIKQGGIDTEQAYPYAPVRDTCKFNPSAVGAKIANWTALPESEDELAAWLWKNGPISIGINAGWMQTYSHGIAKPLFCNPKALDHGVLLVGYGTHKGLFGTEKFWVRVGLFLEVFFFFFFFFFFFVFGFFFFKCLFFFFF
jgi:cathepsin F